MAKQQSSSRKRSKNEAFKTLGAATTLLACMVQVLGGVMVGARTSKILFRCGVSSVMILVVFALVLWVMSRYEEIHSGKA